MPKRILAITELAQGLIDEQFSSCNGEPPPGSALDQCGLKDGKDIVREYIEHGEMGVAYEHLAYMIDELDLELPDEVVDDLRSMAVKMGLESPV